MESDKFGIYHVSNTGSCSWYEFAQEIFNQIKTHIHLEPCSTDEFPRKAKRPKYSVLDHLSLRINQFSPMPTWENALTRFLLDEKVGNQ